MSKYSHITSYVITMPKNLFVTSKNEISLNYEKNCFELILQQNRGARLIRRRISIFFVFLFRIIILTGGTVLTLFSMAGS